jgi:hypothetical protein
LIASALAHEGVREKMAKRIPLRRLGGPEDIANAGYLALIWQVSSPAPR